MDFSPNVTILLLAAGEASRMGEPKQLLKVQEESLLRRMLRICFSTTFRPVITVLGAYADRIYPEIEEVPTTVLINEHWQEGIGSSIAAGAAAVEKIAPATDAVLILLCDQPLVNAELLDRLVGQYSSSGKPIIASAYANTIGVPAVFGKRFFPELQGLTGNQGAKKIMLQHPDDLGVVPFSEGHVDLDTPEDYKVFLARTSFQ